MQCAMVREEGDDQLCGSGRDVIAGCHCSVLWLGGVDDQLPQNHGKTRGFLTVLR